MLRVLLILAVLMCGAMPSDAGVFKARGQAKTDAAKKPAVTNAAAKKPAAPTRRKPAATAAKATKPAPKVVRPAAKTKPGKGKEDVIVVEDDEEDDDVVVRDE